jgi:hypothetical protein
MGWSEPRSLFFASRIAGITSAGHTTTNFVGWHGSHSPWAVLSSKHKLAIL